MNILYVDQVGGLSGDMLVSAVVDVAGGDTAFVRSLPLPEAVRSSVRFPRVLKNHIGARRLTMRGQHLELGYAEMQSRIARARFPESVRRRVAAVVQIMAEVEARIHRMPLRNFHFHDCADLLVEVFGVFALLERLGVERVCSSPLRLSRGTVRCAHGVIPVPAPAVLELCSGMPVESSDAPYETVTPTGAAILKVLAPEFRFPAMTVRRSGYGAGVADGTVPNVLRVLLGEGPRVPSADAGCGEPVVKLETAIDDMNPQWFEVVFERLFAAGCVDVFLVPTICKKSRPGILLTALAPRACADAAAQAILTFTTTTGVRVQEVARICIPREVRRVRTSFGTIRVKTAVLPEGKTVVRPEYDDVRRLSRRTGRPPEDIVGRLVAELSRRRWFPSR